MNSLQGIPVVPHEFIRHEDKIGDDMKNSKILLAKAKLEKAKRDKIDIYKNDFLLFAKDILMIKDKDPNKGFGPFILNEAQMMIHERLEVQLSTFGRIRAIILKARQQGISTYVAGRTFWKLLYNDDFIAALLAHDQKTTDAIFLMTKNIISYLPEGMMPAPSRMAGHTVVFSHNNSTYNIYTAGSPQAGRGNTPTILHASEVAHWGKAEGVLAGLFQGVPSYDNTEIILESTANGAQGEFHRIWTNAEHEKSQFQCIFLPWHMTSEYSEPIRGELIQDAKEVELVKKYDLTEEQLQFRRDTIVETGEEGFKQEYPSNAAEAFLLSGRGVFNSESLIDDYLSIPTTLESYSKAPRNQFDLDHLGHLETWEHKLNNNEYIIAVDVAYGVGGDADFTVAIVMDKEYRIVAMSRTRHMDPATTGEMLYYLGIRYNMAMIMVERNGPGRTVLTTLEKLKYQNIYKEVKFSKKDATMAAVPGFLTSGQSKPQIVGQLGGVLNHGELRIPSSVMLSELRNFVVHRTESGNNQMKAAHGFKDDTVIALALCIEGLRTESHRLSKETDWRQWDVYTENNIQWL